MSKSFANAYLNGDSLSESIAPDFLQIKKKGGVKIKYSC